MKILLITDELLHGGISKYVVDLSAALVENGQEVTVVATRGPCSTQLSENIRFLHIPLLKDKSYEKRPFGFFISLWIIIQHLKNNKYDIIHSQKRYSDLLARIIARMFNLPHISTCHSVFTNLKYLSYFGDYTIAVSETIRNNLITFFKVNPLNVITIYNGCKPVPVYSDEKKYEFRAKYRILPDTPIIASIGQLLPYKDRITLLQSLVLLRKQNPMLDFMLFIVGEGKQEYTIKQFIKQNNLEKYVELLPANTNIPLIYNVSDFCVLSSIKEGLPYVLLEAASVKKPFIATNVGSVGEFIENMVTGILVPPRDPCMLAKAIKILIEDKRLRMNLGEQAYQKYNNQYNYDLFIKKTLEVYEKVLLKRRCQ